MIMVSGNFYRIIRERVTDGGLGKAVLAMYSLFLFCLFFSIALQHNRKIIFILNSLSHCNETCRSKLIKTVDEDFHKLIFQVAFALFYINCCLRLCSSLDFARGAVVKTSPAGAGDSRDAGSVPGLKRLWSGKWQPTPVLLPGKFHGQRSLVGCSPWGHKKLDTSE